MKEQIKQETVTWQVFLAYAMMAMVFIAIILPWWKAPKKDEQCEYHLITSPLPPHEDRLIKECK